MTVRGSRRSARWPRCALLLLTTGLALIATAEVARAQGFCPTVVAAASIDGCSASPPGFDFWCSGAATAQSVTEGDNCYLVTTTGLDQDTCQARRVEPALAAAPAYAFEARLRIAGADPACPPEGFGCEFVYLFVWDGQRVPGISVGNVPWSVGPGYGVGVNHFGGLWSNADWYLLDVTAWHTYRIEVERGSPGQVRYLVDGTLLAAFPYDELTPADTSLTGVELYANWGGTVWLDQADFNVCGQAPGPHVEPTATSYTTAVPAVITFSGAPGNAHDWVGIYASGAADAAPLQWKYTSGATAGSLGFLGLEVASGYEARLFVNDTLTKIASSTQSFAVVAADATVEPSAASFSTSVPAIINFTGAPGNAHDWVGIYAPGAPDAAPAMWKYTAGATDGSLSFLGLSVASGYEARLFVDNTVVKIATSTQTFSVTGATATVEPSAASYSTAAPAVINFTGAPGNAQDWVGIYGPGAPDAAPAMWKYTGGAVDGSLGFLGLAVASGYEARLFVNNTVVKIATSTQSFSVTSATATVEPSAATYTTAVPAVVNFTGAPGNAQDWVGIYGPGAPDAAPAMWKYTGGAVDGSLGFLGLAVASGYEARLFVNNSVTRIATSTQTFGVTAATATAEPTAASYTRAYPAMIDFSGAPGNATDWIGIYAPGAPDASAAMWKYTGGAASGSLGFLGLPIGDGYEARLFVANATVKIATSTQQFSVTPWTGTLESSAPWYSPGDTVLINFSGAPGNAHDWIGVFAPGAPDAAPVQWHYLGGAQSGGSAFTGLAEAAYEARLFVDDSLVRLATSSGFLVQFVCTPTTCAALGFDCGAASDGCGGALECGTCAPPRSCGGSGLANVCGCAPKVCGPRDCGVVLDGCGGTRLCPCGLDPNLCGGAP